MASSSRKPSLLLFLAVSLLLAAVETAGSEMHSATYKDAQNQYPFPPAMMPGMSNDHRRRREVEQLNFIPERYSTSSLDHPVDTPIRMRRFRSHQRAIPEIPMSTRRNKRDLRRLRRDLGYATQYAQPHYGRTNDFTYGGYAPSPSPSKSHSRPDFENDLSTLLQGADLLDRLSILKQMQGIRPAFRPEKHWPVHGPPSRFAPQPKLFEDDPQFNIHPQKVQVAPLGWSAPNPKGTITWSPQKRWLKSHPGDGLSMVPGFKRSMFREAVRNQDDEPPLSQKEMMTLASMLGAEMDPTEKRIRRTAM